MAHIFLFSDASFLVFYFFTDVEIGLIFNICLLPVGAQLYRSLANFMFSITDLLNQMDLLVFNLEVILLN